MVPTAVSGERVPCCAPSVLPGSLSLLLSPLRQRMPPASPGCCACSERWWGAGGGCKALGSEMTSKGQQGPSLEGRGLHALRGQSKRAACNRGVVHRKYNPRQHPTEFLPPPWLVLLQWTLPTTPWPLPAGRTPHPFLPHPWPPRRLALISVGGLFGVSWSWWPLGPTRCALEEPGTVLARVLRVSKAAGSEGLSLTASLPAGPGCAGPVLCAE